MTRRKVYLNSPAAIERHLRRDIEPAGFDSNGVRFVLCDDRNLVYAHVHFGEMPAEVSSDDCAQTMSSVAETVAQGAILVALTRPGSVALTPADGRWYRVARQVCTDREVRLLGVHVVTPRGQREVVLDDVL